MSTTVSIILARELSTRVINGAKIRLPLISTQSAVSTISYVLQLPD